MRYGCATAKCIFDWQMPGLGGIETAEKIRRVVGDDAPIILMAYGWTDIEEESKEEAPANGMNARLSKPLGMDLFVQALERFLK